MKERKEENTLFNDTLNTFYLRLYGVRQQQNNVIDTTDIEFIIILIVIISCSFFTDFSRGNFRFTTTLFNTA